MIMFAVLYLHLNHPFIRVFSIIFYILVTDMVNMLSCHMRRNIFRQIAVIEMILVTNAYIKLQRQYILPVEYLSRRIT